MIAPLLFILLGGVLLAIQAPINAFLGRTIGSPVAASCVSFVIGALGLLVTLLLTRPTLTLGGVRELPWWAWTGGLCGAVFVTAATYVAPRLGVATMLTLAIASQLMMAVVLDHVGAFGLERHPVSAGRVFGLVLMIGGALLVRRS
jgi:transporter family-2 protein